MKSEVEIGEGTYIHDSAILVGKVRIGQKCSIWPNVVIRGDENRVEIGDGTNIQDNSVLHTSYGSPIKIGERVTIGHGSLVHACTIGDDVLIGMGSIIMDRSTIGRWSLVGAGSLITEGKEIPANSFVFGRPSKVVGDGSRYKGLIEDGYREYDRLRREYLGSEDRE
jgi:carbonic anhydrase/acetyltransferase-like protein (isoleucine patch superfamily)